MRDHIAWISDRNGSGKKRLRFQSIWGIRQVGFLDELDVKYEKERGQE